MTRSGNGRVTRRVIGVCGAGAGVLLACLLVVGLAAGQVHAGAAPPAAADTVAALGATPGAIADVHEPDDSVEQARVLQPDSGVVTATIFPREDVDWKVFDTVPGRAYRVNFPDPPPDYAGYAGATVYDGDLNPLPHSWFVAEGARYYVKLAGYSGWGGDGGTPPSFEGTYRVEIVSTELFSISGRVTDAAGNLVGGITVKTNYPDDSAESQVDGRFTIAGLQKGSYLLETTNDQGYQDVAYKNVPILGWFRPDDATLVEVDGRNVTGIDFVLPLPREISGTVKDDAGHPLAAHVVVSNAAGVDVAQADTDPATGSFSARSLAPGEYRVRAESAQHLSAWYLGVPVVSDGEGRGARMVDARAKSVTGVDFALTEGSPHHGDVLCQA